MVGFAFVDEFVEGLGLAEHGHVVAVAVGAAAEEGFHVEIVQ